MHILELPIPAFQCLVEHMAVTVGFYKATRLRLVCSECPSRIHHRYTPLSVLIRRLETFDDEVSRAILKSGIFDIASYSSRKMHPSMLRMHLEARVSRPHLFAPTPLINAMEIAATALIDPGADVETASKMHEAYMYALCDAAACGWYDQELYESLKPMSDTLPNELDGPGHMLSAAAAVGDLQTVQSLLSRDVYLYTATKYFGYALQNAARIGHEKMVSVILDAFDLCLPPSSTGSLSVRKETLLEGSIVRAMQDAIRRSHTHIVQLLLKCPPQLCLWPDQIREDGIFAAAYFGSADILHSMLEGTESRRKTNMIREALVSASSSGHLNVILMLLDSGLGLGSFLDCQDVCLRLASQGGYTRIVRFLLERPGTSAQFMRSHLTVALVEAARGGHRAVARLLLDAGADIDSDIIETHPIIAAARNGETGMVGFLLDNRVNKLSASFGDDAIQAAVQFGHEHTVQLLAERGVAVDGIEGRNPPLRSAVLYGQGHVVVTLCKLGAKEVAPLKAC